MKALRVVMILGAIIGVLSFFGIVLAGTFGYVSSNSAIGGAVASGFGTLVCIAFTAQADLAKRGLIGLVGGEQDRKK